VLEASLRALHPFIPFITEELWHRVPRPSGSPIALALAPFPDERTGRRDEAAERDMAELQAVISAARSIRSEHEVHPGAEVPLTLRTDDPRALSVLKTESRSIRTLVKTAGEPVIEGRGAARPRGAVMSVAAGTEVLVALKGLVEGAKEGARVEREIKKVEKDVAALEKKLALPAFADKAPKEVVDEAKGQLEELRRKRAALEEARGLAAELAE
jgi:valyl-tRNA synthetase